MIFKRSCLLLLLLFFVFIVSCDVERQEDTGLVQELVETEVNDKADNNESTEVLEENKDKEYAEKEKIGVENQELEDVFKTHALIEVEGDETDPIRLPNVVVDVGYGERVYWAVTNAYGQLVNVYAEEIVLQDDTTEGVTSEGRYYSQIASVKGTEDPNLDRGHVIADSLGGVANAYNITPQNSTLNRHGDQAYMERVIRDAGGATDFKATILYTNTETNTPSKYIFEYTVKGNKVKDEFNNESPEGSTEDFNNNPNNYTEEDLDKIDTNNNGIITITEAKIAGFIMPIYVTDWLYAYMIDGNDNGMVGE